MLTKNIVNERLSSRSIELIGEYLGSRQKTLFRCGENHEWFAKPAYLFDGKGCPTCADTTLTKNIVNDRLKFRGIELIEEYVNAQTRVLFRCSSDHEWRAEPGAIMYGNGCPMCACSGFNPNKPAHAYVLNFGDYIKYGISNNLKVRLKSHRRNNGIFTLVLSHLFESGIDALNWENNIKNKFGGNYVTKRQCPDGYTETLSLSLLKEIIHQNRCLRPTVAVLPDKPATF